MTCKHMVCQARHSSDSHGAAGATGVAEGAERSGQAQQGVRVTQPKGLQEQLEHR